MQSFKDLSASFEAQFNVNHFPAAPESLYEACNYFLQLGGKRVRPAALLMANELFDEITPDAWQVANAIEIFHNFTLIHDDIMDKAPIRRGKATVHMKYTEPTALLAGDVMMVKAYDFIQAIHPGLLKPILSLFNKTAAEVCEGQQMDMDFEQQSIVKFDDYLQMITLKTSVLLAASMKMGAIIGGAGQGNQHHLYEFGKKLGIAFQVQDDYLDAFGNPEKFGKQAGGDIHANKKTFLLIHALETLDETGKAALIEAMQSDEPGKVEKVLNIFRDCKADIWAKDLKEKYFAQAMQHLDDVAVLSGRKNELEALAIYLLQREH